MYFSSHSSVFNILILLMSFPSVEYFVFHLIFNLWPVLKISVFFCFDQIFLFFCVNVEAGDDRTVLPSNPNTNLLLPYCTLTPASVAPALRHRREKPSQLLRHFLKSPQCFLLQVCVFSVGNEGKCGLSRQLGYETSAATPGCCYFWILHRRYAGSASPCWLKWLWSNYIKQRLCESSSPRWGQMEVCVVFVCGTGRRKTAVDS